MVDKRVKIQLNKVVEFVVGRQRPTITTTTTEKTTITVKMAAASADSLPDVFQLQERLKEDLRAVLNKVETRSI